MKFNWKRFLVEALCVAVLYLFVIGVIYIGGYFLLTGRLLWNLQ
jgi:hypothetical protein